MSILALFQVLSSGGASAAKRRATATRAAAAAVLGTALVLGGSQSARAYPAYATAGTSRAPNAVTMGCRTCHNNASGGSGCGSPPCFNLFGAAFDANGETWNPALAALDSDSDGWTNGEELLDVSGTWPDGGADPGVTARARLPGYHYSQCYSPFFISRACPMDDCVLDYDDCDGSPIASCVEEDPYFDCVCPAGYGGSGNGASGCSDIDECSAGNPCNENILGSGNGCANASPRYNCTCGTGWRITSDGTFSETCSDIDECVEDNYCLEDTVGGNSCLDSNGRFDCTCGAQGYQLVNNGSYPERCQDINECTAGNPCNEDGGTGNGCSNLTPRYDCSCTTGYVLQNNGAFTETCADVNECMTAGICGVGSCFNNAGGYSCACPSGFTFNGTTCVDINECGPPGSPTGVCGVGTCSNSSGSYSCTCPGGYTFNGVTCEVNNACNAGTDNCADSEGAICTAMGSMSWTCSCPSGYVGNGTDRRAGGTGCTNVNECTVTPTICGVGRCTDVPGTYTCSCPTGYSFNGTTCVDVNECGTPGTCGPGTCMNTVGSYVCTCNAGYTAPPSGGSCVDVNECATAATCNAASGWGSCTNTVGGFTCACAVGYEGSGTGLMRTCVNTDECTSARPCGVGTCTDTVGSYRCSCPSGYTAAPMGGTCDDVDECTDAARCGGTMGFGTCVNEPGTFSCACNSGFEVSGSGASRTCVNVDECARDLDDCDVNAICADDVPASGGLRFTCTCIEGWQGPGNLCEDFDECTDPDANDCSPLGHCVNEVGTYGCECNEGYNGNGFDCTDANECATAECGVNEVCINQLGVLPANALCECEPGTVRSPIDDTCGSACGNGQRVIGEECDDGDADDGDGCSSECLVEEGWACIEPAGGASECTPGCGDGLIDVAAGEECDEGIDNDDTAPDACRDSCRIAHCGDTVVDTGEECDLGEVANASRTSNGCRPDCRMAFCGDGLLDDGEYCDEGVVDPDAGTHVELPIEACTIACLGDVGTSDAGVPGAEPAVIGSTGCGCTVAGSHGRASMLAGLIGLGLALAARRRRR
jgi:MYXO-CTERM domain-containing protein